MSELDLDWFRTNPQSPDVLGLDYYPHSDWQLDRRPATVRQRRADNPVGLYGVAQRLLQPLRHPADADRDAASTASRSTARSGSRPRSTTSAACAKKACRCSA